MSTILLFCSGILLCLVAWQDFRERAISVWLLVLLTVSEFLYKYVQTGAENLLLQFAQNSLIIFSQLIIIWTYTIVKNRKWINLFRTGFGIADLILLLILGINFAPFIFVLFMLGGCVIAISSTLIVRLFFQITDQTVQLAGYLSIWTLLVMILTVMFPQHQPSDDQWLFYILNSIL